ncbi:chemokine XC receptor 1 [Silurus meridionalis]|uniref:G-protein coupled receptors family 1 profile domain-containing protein n=1 Tax=Silurus meridionalis TaxID=175797 RepID=A0A8T0ANP6_SILME|nr:chemokine XC receptor 1 [Silurus meridionalis]KAF7692394.1 hypothetical protein HF521_010004 [Silurus meridionalis]KAI5092678.1 chemokine XC receptor 1-like [Silurus meridionalis]
MDNVNQSSEMNDSYEYIYDGLIVQCHLEKYDHISGICFIAICCFSFLGNGLLVYALARYEDLKRVTMLFLLYLAVFDLLFTMTLPFWAVDHLIEWIFGDFMCKVLTGAYFVGLYGSLMLLTAMTVDCFFFIVVRSQWFTWRRRLYCAKAAFVGSALISFGASMKEVLNSTVETEHSVRLCRSLSSDDDHVGYYTQFAMLFVLPLVIISLCYGKILHTIMSSSGRRRYKTVLVVFLIILAFVVCWGPYHVVLIVKPQKPIANCRLDQIFIACRILAYFHCCVNPLLFLIRARSRKILSTLLCCKPQHRSTEPSDRSSDPSYFNNHQRASIAIPQNVTELKSI